MISCLRYFYALARVQRIGFSNLKEAMLLLSRALPLIRSAATNPHYIERRPGQDGVVQLDLQGARFSLCLTFFARLNFIAKRFLGF